MVALSYLSIILLLLTTSRVGSFWLSFLLFILGLLLSLAKRERAYIFAFLLPIVNALPFFIKSGLPYNYFAPSLFLLAGLFLGTIPSWKNFKLPPAYGPFLLFLWTSAFFLLLRWSNISLSKLAFLKDTPVTTGGPRLSFGIFFPFITLALYSVGFLAFYLFESINFKKALKFISGGIFISTLIGLLQWAGFKFMTPIAGWENNIRFNGTFSDPNAAGTFSGIIFALIVFYIEDKKDISFAIPPLLMILLSNSKTGLIFVFISLVFILFSGRVSKKLRVIIILSTLLLSIPFFPHLKRRLEKNYNAIFKWKRKNLDFALTGRIKLTKMALTGIKEFPISGIGAGNFLFYSKYKFGRSFDIVPSVYLSNTVENGITGGLFFLLFLLPFAAGRASPQRNVFYLILFVFLFNNGIWNPEVMIIFWIVLAGIKPTKLKLPLKFVIPAFLLFIAGEIFSFNSLHPATWSIKKGTYYDYGFHQLENNYRWTSQKAGLYKAFKGEIITLETGFPFEKTKYTRQIIDIYWKGKKIKRVILNRIKTQDYLRVSGTGFLEFRIKPYFVPSRLGLSKDPRTLGIKISGIW